MLIFKATLIPEIQKSPAELLNSHKYRTNLPMIDFSQSRNDEPIEKLMHKCEVKAKTGKELPKLDIGTPVLYDKIQIVLRLRDLSGVRAPSEIGRILTNMKFLLTTQIGSLQDPEGILKPI